MSAATLFLFEDRLPAGAKPVYLPRGDRALYMRAGAIELATDTETSYLQESSAAVVRDELTVTGGDTDSVLWRWELAPGDSLDDAPHLLRSAPHTTSELKLKASVDLDERYTWMMRCDTVTFPPGGVAWTHLHQGPGIRIVDYGQLTIDTEGAATTYSAGEAWAEKGVAPVYAPASPREETRFVRCFLVPKQNKGDSSLRIVDAADRKKTNTQQYRVLAERVLTAR